MTKTLTMTPVTWSWDYDDHNYIQIYGGAWGAGNTIVASQSANGAVQRTNSCETIMSWESTWIRQNYNTQHWAGNRQSSSNRSIGSRFPVASGVGRAIQGHLTAALNTLPNFKRDMTTDHYFLAAKAQVHATDTQDETVKRWNGWVMQHLLKSNLTACTGRRRPCSVG